MSEDNRKIVMLHLTIGIATATILILSCIATLAFLAGELRTSNEHLTQQVGKWDEQVIALNERMFLLENTK